jgi:hypothetical protein
MGCEAAPAAGCAVLAECDLDGKPVERIRLQGTTRLLFLPLGTQVDLDGASPSALRAHQTSSPADQEPLHGPSS